MGVGFEVYNDAGTLQVSQDYATLALRTKGSLALNAKASDNGGPLINTYSGTITVAAAAPVVAFQCTSAALIRRIANNGDGTWTLEFYSQGGTSLNWWLFDYAPQATGTSSDFGLQVFNAAGQLTYDLLHAQALIAGVIVATGSLSLTSGRAYAVLQTGLGGFRDHTVNDAGTTDLVTMNGCSVNGANIVAGYSTYRRLYAPHATNDPGQQRTQSYGGFVVVDVTGLN